MKNKKSRNLLIAAIVSTMGIVAFGAFVTSIGMKNVNAFLKSEQQNGYTLNLNNSNAVTSSGTHTMYSTTSGAVRFDYTNVSASSGNHCAITAGGTIVNKDVIHSISSFVANFSGSLQARIGYTQEKMGDYFDLTSGNKIDFGSLPYYLELKAVSSVSLSSVTYEYTCAINPDAEAKKVEGSYDISFKKNDEDGTKELTSNQLLGEVLSGNDYISSTSNLLKVYSGSEGLKFGSSKGAGSVTFSFDSSEMSQPITTIDVSSAKYGSDSGNLLFYVNDSTTAKAVTPGTDGSIIVNAPIRELTVSTTSKRAYLSNLSFNYDSTENPSAPIEAVGFTASDINKNNYTSESIFDEVNGLNVKAIYSNGTQESITKGNDGYSYVVKDSKNQTIDTSKKFGEVGIYKLIVSYKHFIPVEKNLMVGEHIAIEDITPSIDKATYLTSDKLSDYLVGNLSAVITYSNGDTDTLSYSSFADNGLLVSLLTPRGFTYDQNKPFGTEGQWSIVINSAMDSTVFGSIKITVNAVLVEEITLNHSSKDMVVDETLQLVAAVGPSNVTNNSVYWESSNVEVATVNDEGLVTAVGSGATKITATAADGSGVTATCDITVASKPSIVETTIDATTAAHLDSSSESKVTFVNDKVTVTITKESSSTKANNYIPSAYTETRVYSGQKLKISASNETVSSIVIHGTSSKGVNGISGTWNNASCTTDGYEVTLTPTNANSDVYCNVSGTSSFSRISVYIGEVEVETIYPDSINLTSSKTSISIGETAALSVSYSPNTTNVKNVSFSSSDDGVATVSNKGIVTGVSAGVATIKASAEGANSTKVEKTINIEVKTVAVTSVSLNQQSASVKAGKSITLVATILPSNATNKNITWSTSSSSIATVSNGTVTGVAAGEVTITATTQDGNKTASCVVTVTASSSASTWELVTSDSTLMAGDVLVIASKQYGATAGNISSQIMSSISSTFDGDTIENLGEDTVQLTLGGNEGNWTLANDDGQLLGATAVKKLAWDSGTTTWTIKISGGDVSIYNTNDSCGQILYNSSSPRFTCYTSNPTDSISKPQLYRGGTSEPTDPTDIILDQSSLEMYPNSTKNLAVSYIPYNANQNKDITWTTSNSSVATVNDGQVTVLSTATAGQTATITATLTQFPAIKKTCLITVVEKGLDDQTVMIYLCGSNLESGTDDNGNVPSARDASGLASGDIDEILKVSGQPDDVNIIIETGGANIWQSGHSYSISNTKLERWHVENRSLVKDDSLSYANMGLTSTFQSFLEWGLTNYPAQRTGVVLWNHGGGMHGVCYDEKSGDDSLLNSEVTTAVKNAFNSTGRSTSDKLEWIGYDACLMSVQDIAEFNSKYFNYQVSSEESEAGYGWDYDNWVDNLYKKNSTPDLLQEICDTFIADNGGVNRTSGDQTLSYLDLSYMSEYLSAWESMTSALRNKLTSSNKSTFNTAIKNNVKHYADSDYDYFCLFDAKDFINKLASNSAFTNFKINSEYTNAVLTAHSKVVKYSTCQKGAGNSYGLCMYWTNSSQYSFISTYYTTTQTHFTNWQSFCNTYGTHR